MGNVMKRIFLIVLDSVGIGAMEDAGEYGDIGANTLASVAASPYFFMPHMQKLGLFAIDGVCCGSKEGGHMAAIARMKEASKGKDTIIGHWEMAGIYSAQPLPVYPDGFPPEVLEGLKRITGRGILCNRPYSGTEAIRDFGDAHRKTGDLIVYTSADHGCDPGYTASTDHSREYTPFLLYKKGIRPRNFGTRETFADIGATVLDYFHIKPVFHGAPMQWR